MQARTVVVHCLLMGFLAMPAPASAATRAMAPREVVSLDGTWHIEQGGMDALPKQFTHTVAVPGLADMAKPAFQDVGKKSPLREAFWYRRTFTLDRPLPDVAILKIHKARYGTKVWLNGKPAGVTVHTSGSSEGAGWWAR